jgi:hypothetical protein
MSANERDTHFAGAASALRVELTYASQSKVVGNSLVRVPPEHKEAEAIIARFLYDFACHVIVSYDSDIKSPEAFFLPGDSPVVPDLTEWPKP